MESFSGYTGDIGPDDKGSEKSAADSKKDAKKKSAETGFSLIESKAPEKKEKTVENFAKAETMWQRIVGEDAEAEPTESPDAEGEIDLADDKAKEIAIEHVAEERQPAVAAELAHAEPGSVEAAEAAADAVLLEKDVEHLGSEDVNLHEALDHAALEAEQVVRAVHEEPPVAEMPEQVVPHEEAEDATPEGPARLPQAPFMAEQMVALHEAPTEPSAPQQPEVIRETVIEKQTDHDEGLFADTILEPLFSRSRRIRRRIEHRLRPFQRKVEKDIAEVKAAVAEKEVDIRQLAADQYRLREETSARIQALRRVKTSPTAERRAANKTAEIQPKASWEQSHEVLSDQEVLAWSEKIVVDGASVRSVYEARRISENGLKHIVYEYLRGGNVRKVLAEEVLRKELSYERDPRLREHFEGSEITGAASPAFAAQSSSSLLSAPPMPSKKRKPTARAAISEAIAAPQKLALLAWATLVFVLAAIVLILWFR